MLSNYISYLINLYKSFLKYIFMNLTERGKELRIKVLDLAVEKAGGHLGGSFSEIEILLALFDSVLKNKENKFILSKGHACYPLYILLRERGFNPKISEHPDIDLKNNISCTTGSLGHGLPIGVGMALSRKFKKQDGKIFVLMGDGECEEGTTWESLLIASHHKLDNLTIIIDYNKLQALQKIEEISSLGDLKSKFEAFGCYVTEANGHDILEIIKELEKQTTEKPHIILAHTTKGKGVSFMENDPKWHGRRPTLERVKGAYEELK